MCTEERPTILTIAIAPRIEGTLIEFYITYQDNFHIQDAGIITSVYERDCPDELQEDQLKVLLAIKSGVNVAPRGIHNDIKGITGGIITNIIQFDLEE